ncbi:MAG: hypothetical protein HND53_11030 [Proteobacteria bacterium]|nr:hypothetical protein [Pseudomonadota bacterium]NOG61026.1 hypothetical protein [Pseudomonadota bacterium]
MSDPKSVEAADPTKKTSKITGPVDNDATVITSEVEIKCFWNDEEFGNGDRVTSGGKTYEANNGMWIEV